MKSKSFHGMVCSIAGALEAVGDRWAFLILRDLGLGLRRYDELQESTQIPNTTLSQRLKHLELGGLVERQRYQDNPPRFEYALTAKGREFGLVLSALAQWGDRWDVAGTGSPPVNFVDGATGRRVKLVFVDAHNGALVPGSRIEARAGRGADDLVRWRLSIANATKPRTE
jgi:DNA-binding HxlR family transcriptional regulator